MDISSDEEVMDKPKYFQLPTHCPGDLQAILMNVIQQYQQNQKIFGLNMWNMF